MADINQFVPKQVLDQVEKLISSLGTLNKQYETLDQTIDETNQEFSEQLKKAKELETVFRRSVKTQAQAAAAERDTMRTKKQLLDTQARLTNATSVANKELLKRKRVLNETTREERLLERAQDKSLGTIAKLRAVNNLLRFQREKLNLETKEGREMLKRMNAEIDRNNATLKRNLDALSKQKIGIGGYTRSILRAGGALMAVFGVGGGLFAAVRAFKSTVRAGLEFEREMSKVQAVSGATSKEFAALRKNAMDLGSSTEKTATQVAGLQLELAKLGLTSGQILDVTDSVLDLSTAAGADLSQSAVVAAATMKGFGLEADQMRRITDVMAKSFSSSALDISKFQTAMAYVAPVAKASGVSLEGATAQLSLLVDRGLEASTAGTSLRNIFLELSKKGLTMNEALDKIANSTDKNRTAMELFGKRSAVSALILEENREQALKLTKVYQQSEGAVKRMANVMRDNLKGDTDIAKSAIEGLSLNLFDRLNPALRSSVQAFTELVGKVNDYVKVPMSEKIADEGREVNNLIDSITSLDEENETRLELLNKLNDEYPDILQNMSLEELSNAELIKLQKQYNSELSKRIKLSVFQEDITAKEEEARDAFREEIRVIRDINEAYNKYIKDKEDGATLQDKVIALNDRERYSLDAVNEAAGKSALMMSASGDVRGDVIKNVNGLLDTYNKSLEDQATIEDEILKITQEKNSVLTEGITLDNISALTLSQLKELKFDDVELEKERIRLIDERLKRQKQIEDANKAGRESEEMSKEEKKKAEREKQKVINETAKLEALQAEQILQNQLEYYKKRAKTDEEYMEKKFELSANALNTSIQSIKDELREFKGSASEKIQLQQELIRLEMQLSALRMRHQDDVSRVAEKKQQDEQNFLSKYQKWYKGWIGDNFKAYQKNKKEEERVDKQEMERKMETLEMIAGATAEIGRTLFEGKVNRLNDEMDRVDEAADRELDALERRKDEGIISEEEYSNARKAIELKRDKETRKLKAEEAKANKAAALFDIAINTARGIVAALTSVPPNVPLSITIGVIGALQAATVAAKDIPKFGDGTESSPEGWAEVGEKGRELKIDPSGKAEVVDHSYRYLKRGTKIIPNERTEQILAAGYDSPEVRYDQLIHEMRTVGNIIKGKREYHFNFRTRKISDRKGQYWREYTNRIIS